MTIVEVATDATAAARLASVSAVIPSGKGVALSATVVVELGKVVVAV
jgi:hypothetical protein